MLVSKQAPHFKASAAVNNQAKEISLSDYKGKWVVLFFYPLDFTFVCPTEIMAYNKALPDFKKVNAQLLGVSVDSVFTHIAWIQTPQAEGGLGNLDFPLISDLNKSISRNYEVLLEDAGEALRGTFIIDPDGVVQCAQINSGGVGRSVKETLRLLQGYQFTRDNGDVCPAEWTPGEATMAPDPEKKKEYFAKQG